jgi:hypothetical protein
MSAALTPEDVSVVNTSDELAPLSVDAVAKAGSLSITVSV